MKHSFCKGLVQVAHCWLDRQYPLRQQALGLAASEFCLSPENFTLALDWIFSQWTEARITEIATHHPFKKSRYAVQVLAGTTPAMIAQGFLQGTILNISQCLKVPHKQPTFAQLLHQSFTEIFNQGAQLFELISRQDDLPHFYAKLAQADLVLAYGQDETMAVLKKYLAPGATFIAHGHAESAALIFKPGANLNYLEKLTYDFLSYDQRGCLSPRVVWVEEGGELSAADCARVFSETVLPPMAQQLPRGGLFPGEAAEILHQRSLSRFHGPVYCGADWTVCYDEKQDWSTVALPRFIVFRPFRTIDELNKILLPIRSHLICLGHTGPQTTLAQLHLNPATRFCALGEMQKQLLVF